MTLLYFSTIPFLRKAYKVSKKDSAKERFYTELEKWNVIFVDSQRILNVR
jgi:hypothetical protein